MSRAADAARSVAWALLLTPVVAACGGDSPGEVLRSDDAYVIVGAEGDGDNVAGFGYGGRVEMVGACLGIDGRTVIWPYGTEILSDEPLVIDVPDLGRVAVGDAVDGGGADWAADQLPEGVDAVPNDCPGDEVIAFYPG